MLDAFFKQLTPAESVSFERLLEATFEHQRRAVLDGSRRIGIRTPRRAGKTVAIFLKALACALTVPHARIVYLALTLEQAADNFIPVVEEFNRKYRLGLTVRGSKQVGYEVRVNDSIILVRSGETLRRLEKFRGQKYHMFIIDEGKSFVASILREAIDDIIWPSLDDYKGQLVLAGTPGHILAGPFYEATSGDASGYSVHTWTRLDNTHVPHLHQVALETKELNRWSDDNPTWRREYLGEWCPADAFQVFPFFDPEQHVRELENNWSVRIGLRLNPSHTDSGFAVIGTHRRQSHILAAEAFQWKRLDELGKLLTDLNEKHRPTVFELSSESFKDTMAVKLRQQTRLPIRLWDKKSFDLNDTVEIINTDLAEGILTFPQASPLMEEWGTLSWDEEDPTQFAAGLTHTITDAVLPAWRSISAARPRTEDLTPKFGTPEYYEWLSNKQFAEALNARK